MDYELLRGEIQNDPTGKGYAQFLPDSPGRVVELLNAQTETMIKPRMITARTIMAECNEAEAILAGIKGAAGSSVQAECAWNFLNLESGLDIGNEKALLMCSEFVNLGIWSSTQSAQVTALAVLPASRAEVIGFGYIHDSDVRDALRE